MPVPPIADASLFVVLNAASGSHDAAETHALISRLLAESGRRHRLVMAQPGEPIAELARRMVSQAMAAGGVVVAAGGDGTINAVAQAAHDAGCPMGVLPQGTFNYFSRTQDIPLDTAQAIRALFDARLEPVQVGLVNEQVFLVNASLGLYPELLEDREQFKARFGRHRVVALAAAVATLLRAHRQLRLRIELDGVVRDLRTPTLFVGNNRLQLEQVGLAQAGAIERGRIAAVMLRPVGTAALLALLLRGALGTLGDAERVVSFEFQRMTVAPWLPYGARGVKVALDGEVRRMRSPLEFRVSRRPLYLLKPARQAAPAADTIAAAAAGSA
ncbi:MAG TPA: diacylglycerol kinase family protein [Albitalea sp.]